MSDLIRENYQRFGEEGFRAEFRIVQTEGYGVRARSSYYDYEDRLILVDYRVVPEDDVPEEERADRTEDDDRTGFDGAGEWMAANPLRDVVDEVGDD